MLRRTLAVWAVGCAMLWGGLAAAEEGFTPLFDGKSVEGWTGDPELWSVADGVIVGTTETKDIKKNSFLTTKKTYKNFVLKAKFKLRNGNSGIQLRSKLHDDYRVTGYQADIADNQFLGILYEEGGRGILAKVEKPEEVKAAFKAGEWNEYVITVDGKKITQVLNGTTTISFTDAADKGADEGVVALQIHVGPKMKIEFKDIEIKELP